MALTPMPFIAPPPEEKKKKGHKGGFGVAATAVGAVAGGVIGGMAGSVAPGAGTAAGAMAGTAAGASLGGMLGEAVDPSKQATSVMAQRAQTQAPQMIQSETSQKLKESIAALSRAPDPVRTEYSKPLVDAYIASVAQAHKGQV
jgi:uncharacterized protein YcfJ